MTRRQLIFRTLATMVALRVPWGVAKATVVSDLRLVVPIGEKTGGISLLVIGGPKWRLITKLKVKAGLKKPFADHVDAQAALQKLTSRWGLSPLEKVMPFITDDLHQLVVDQTGYPVVANPMFDGPYVDGKKLPPKLRLLEGKDDGRTWPVAHLGGQSIPEKSFRDGALEIISDPLVQQFIADAEEQTRKAQEEAAFKISQQGMPVEWIKIIRDTN